MTEKVVPELMNTREVARYLGINDKKVYFLAKAGKIPCTRVTGKWTFPKKLIDRWIEESASGLVERKAKTEERDFLLAAGSDDPSLGILHDLYEAQTQTASFFMTTIGSSAGLAAIRSGVADFATAHLLEPARTGADNLAPQELLPSDTVVVELFYRELGMLVAAGNPKSIKSLRDLARPKLRIINRQPGSGTRIYLDQELSRFRLNGKKISGYGSIVSTHLEVGLRVLGGAADVGLATLTTAQLLGLDFIPFIRERFDLLVPKDRFFTRGIQALLGIVGSREFRERVDSLGGYDVTESGRIINLS
ncbi:MAG TPA: substrate-binding domain-containing protein [Candidatus Binatia bacterium]|nr:substrate-binding domain-containing protein [Candidatus Binatia bacterium]